MPPYAYRWDNGLEQTCSATDAGRFRNALPASGNEANHYGFVSRLVIAPGQITFTRMR